MLFNSFAFIGLFLPLSLGAYWVLRKSYLPRAGILALAVASYIYYLYGETTYPWLIVASIVFNFTFGRWISVTKDVTRHVVFMIGVGVNLSLLGYFKYARFLADNLYALTGISVLDHSITLPVGISFFTFTQVAFLVDAYRKGIADASPANFFLFVTFFPHLIAGPILHHTEMMPQFARRHTGSVFDSLAAGLPLFAIGLFKKCAIADSLSPFVSALFAQVNDGRPITLLEAWAAALGYTMQIYFDFSGYSDMAIGLARMFSINLPINFNSPYKSASIIEFWRRWHITLSRFLRDYLYVSLGGGKRGQGRRYANLFITMVLGGMWHGAGWTFLLWGALHGVYLCAAHLWRHVFPKARLGRAVGGALTLLCVIVAWVPFRAPSMAAAANMWMGMAGAHGIAVPDWSGASALLHNTGLPIINMAFGRGDLAITVGAFLGCLLLPNSQEWGARFKLGLDSPGYGAVSAGAASRWWAFNWNWQTAVAAGAIFGVALRSVGEYSEFIYFQF